MGSNSDSKLGIGTQDIRSVNVPTLVEGINNVVKVSCGNSHTIALVNDGSAFTWGQAFYGALGIQNSSSVQN